MIIDLTCRRKHFETTSFWNPNEWVPITEDEFDEMVVKNRRFFRMYYEDKYQYFVHIAADNIIYRRY